MYRKENFGILAVLLLFSTIFAYDFGYTHPGRTDAHGGHYNRRTGEYHYHGGGRSRPRVDVSPAVPENLTDIKVDTPLTVETSNTGRVSRRSELRLAAWEHQNSER